MRSSKTVSSSSLQGRLELLLAVVLEAFSKSCSNEIECISGRAGAMRWENCTRTLQVETRAGCARDVLRTALNSDHGNDTRDTTTTRIHLQNKAVVAPVPEAPVVVPVAAHVVDLSGGAEDGSNGECTCRPPKNRSLHLVSICESWLMYPKQQAPSVMAQTTARRMLRGCCGNGKPLL